MLIEAARNYNTGTCSLTLENLIQRRRVSGKIWHALEINKNLC
jgi:hypothetical protein